MSEAQYIDIDVCLGRPSLGNALTVDSLIAEMDRLGVAEACVYHAVAQEHHPRAGNALLADALRSSPRLHPVWVALPHHTGEMPPPDEFVRGALSAGARAVRLFPSAQLSGHRVALRSWVVGPLLAALEAATLPLLLDFQTFRRGEPPWDDIVDICRNHPQLPVVLIEIQGRNNRNVYPLLEQHANLFIQTGGFNVHQGIEDVCARFGPERLLFGSHYPRASMGAAKLHIDRAQISDSDRELIAGGSLRRLLGEVKDGNR